MITIQLPGRKRSRNVESFETRIGHDAIQAIKQWLEERDASAPRNGPIFLDQFGKGITKGAIQICWRRKSRRLGIIPPRSNELTNRTGKSPHELRDSFRTLWAISGAATHIAKSLMGHTTDDLGYDKSFKNPRFVDQEYRKAMKFLNILSSSRAYGQVSEDEVEHLQRRIRELEAGKSSEVEAMKAEIKDLKSEFAELVKVLKRGE
jgi:integrase